MNQEVRRTVVERDKNECQLSRIFGIAHLSGVPCVEEIEVHHKTYDRAGHEIENDLISVCRRCHDFLTSYIRGLRYLNRSETIIEDNVESGLPVKTLEKYEDGDSEISFDGDQPNNLPQWTIGRSIKYLDKEAKEGFFSAQEDREGL